MTKENFIYCKYCGAKLWAETTASRLPSHKGDPMFSNIPPVHDHRRYPAFHLSAKMIFKFPPNAKTRLYDIELRQEMNDERK